MEIGHHMSAFRTSRELIMIFSNLLAVLFFLFSHCLCATDEVLGMTLWQAPKKSDLWKDQPTWHQETSAASVLGSASPDYQGVLYVASAHYNWLENQPKAVTSKGACLVAAYWDPVTNMIYASTIPRGPRKDFMINQSKSNGAAPLWYNQMKSLISLKPAPIHAEDGVFFNWETSKGARTANGQYPPGSILVVWGKFSNDASDRQINLCSIAKSRNPTCQDVAKALGVSFTPTVQETLQLAQEDNSDESYAEDLTSADGHDVACKNAGQSKRFAIRGRDALMRRDKSSCTSISYPTDVFPSTVSMNLPSIDFSTATKEIPTGPITTASGPTPSCSMQFEDPDRGIASAYCVCDDSITLPLQSALTTAVVTESCHYLSIPISAQITPTTTLDPATTDTKYCQVCTLVVNNEGSCSTIPGCIVQTGAVTVQAGSSPVHVGTLTSTELYTSVSNALETLCPPATQTTSMTACSTDSVTVKGINYVDDLFISTDGELVISVKSSQYNLTSLRDAMIKSAAMTAQNAATGNNCYNKTYDVESLKARDGLSSLWSPRLFARSDHPYAQEVKSTFCNTVGFAGVNYYDPYWRVQASPGATDWIDARWSFHVGPGGDFACELLQDFVDAFAIVEPEFAVEDTKLGNAIDVLCKEILDEK